MARKFQRSNQIKMIGFKQLDSFLEGMIANVIINLTKIEKRLFPKVIGINAKMKS